MKTKRVNVLLFLCFFIVSIIIGGPTVKADEVYYTWDSSAHGASINAPLGQLGAEAEADADITGLLKIHVSGGYGFYGLAEAWGELYTTLNGQGYSIRPNITYEAQGFKINYPTATITLTIIDRKTGETVGQWSDNLPYSPSTPVTKNLTGDYFEAKSDRTYCYWVKAYASAPIVPPPANLASADYYNDDRHVKVNYLSIIPQYSGGGGGSCPYVSTWNGTCYVVDNEVSELEQEHSYLDLVKLLAVDHNSNINVAVSPYGEILTYGNAMPPVSAVDEDGTDVLSQLNSIDENYYQGYNGSHITITFASTDVSNGVKLVIREDTATGPPLLKCPVYVQVLNEAGEWNTIATFHTRTYWATDIINMTGYLPDPEGNLRVRLCFVSNDKIDYIGLDTTPQASIETHEANLTSAFHSTQGNVRLLLMENDQTYAELILGEQIQLTFQLPNNQNQKRTFILYTEGHYNTIA